jgi:hypothetical protein
MLPEPPLAPETAPLTEGEIVMAALPNGATVGVRFTSPYEPWLTLDGRRIVDDTSPAARSLLMWALRRKTSLYRALDVLRGLRGVLTPAGIVIVDLVQLDTGAAADHGTLGAMLERIRARSLTFMTLGDADHRIDVSLRARSLFAVGTPVELRVEDRGSVVSRRRWRVGR